MGSTAEHQDLVNEILKKYGAHQYLTIWKNATGMAFRGETCIKFGLKGSADILGIMKPYGRFIAIECKSGKAQQSAQQKAFQKMIIDFGGVYIVARSIEDVDNLILNHI